MSAPVSVLVPTLDEELNLPECLASLVQLRDQRDRVGEPVEEVDDGVCVEEYA